MSPTRYHRSLFLFHRDLRLDDNTGLTAAAEMSRVVLPCFIVDPRQTVENPYCGEPALQFMFQCLHSLQQQLHQRGGRLYLFSGPSKQLLREILSQQKIEALFCNRDYTPFAQQRDAELKQLCHTLQVDFHQYGDALLNEPEATLKADGTPYTVFTPYWKRCLKIEVTSSQATRHRNFLSDGVEGQQPLPSLAPAPRAALQGGREECHKRISALATLTDYASTRDIPSAQGTSQLSAYIKFGCYSVREIYQQIKELHGPSHPLLRQLYWRDFFSHIGFHFPHIFGRCFHLKYEALPWENDAEKFQRWQQGHTGFPFIDAAMRQLKESGIMHNRARMVVASFLVKDMHTDWRWGEKHFACSLIDYDPAVNNGNWQWAASTGCDAQPYFRVFNPWLQQQKFDADCQYIKHWVPELRDLNAAQIHSIERNPLSLKTYPNPMLDHAQEKDWSEDTFSEIR